MYRGREGQWAFILHRISGIGIAVYLFMHVVNISLVMFGPNVSGPVLTFFHSGVFRVGLLLVIAAVIYHSFNGLRIMLMDFTDWGVKYQAQLWYGVLALCLLFGVPVLIKIVPEIVRDLVH